VVIGTTSGLGGVLGNGVMMALVLLKGDGLNG